MPSMSSQFDDVKNLVDQVATATKGLNGDNHEEARRQCLAVARSLTFALETPAESISRHCWAEQAHHAALRSGIKMKLFEKWANTEGGDAKSSLELAELTGSDPDLVGRLLKHLAAMGSVKEVDANKYALTPFSKTLKDPIYRDAYPSMFEITGPSFFALPQWLSDNNFVNPTDPSNCAFQLGHHSSDRFFKWTAEHPVLSAQYNNHMLGRRTGRTSWMDPGFYPIKENLVKGMQAGPKEVFLVDVGGGKGSDLSELHRKHPDLPGRLVLQDLKVVLDEARESALDPKIVLMDHDFFTEQPIKGARAYYMHHCLHVWPDAKALEVLLALKSAMKKGYSKLLINEFVIPEKDAHWIETALDMMMLTNFGAKQRTENSWRTLLDSAGLKVVKIWSHEPGTESLIEAEIA